MTESAKKDNGLEGVSAALKRAAKRAREIAERTGTPLITYKDGHLQERMVVRESNTLDEDATQETE